MNDIDRLEERISALESEIEDLKWNRDTLRAAVILLAASFPGGYRIDLTINNATDRGEVDGWDRVGKDVERASKKALIDRINKEPA